MGNLSNVNTEERPQMIILGVLTLYFLICGYFQFFYYLIITVIKNIEGYFLL